MYYSQAGEDQYLNDNYFKDKKNGKYIELGAMDGDTLIMRFYTCKVFNI